ncbi:MAG TPA: M43 family zinc metalloprotease [Puia sp.]|nr:M43 family zinc metalloprotease [Puia sp.]
MKQLLPLIGYLLIVLPGWAQPVCRSFDYRQQQLSAHPGLTSVVEGIEQFTRRQLQQRSVEVTGQAAPLTSPTVITIPVIVHVLYNNSSENISNAQIKSQIDELNRDYQKMNPDTARIPSYFSGIATDCGFHFMLAGIDTNGRIISGIIRKHTNITAFADNDDMKFSARGGDDAWDRDKYLNIWVCNMVDGILGYSSLVGGPKETDGVVVLYTAFGTTGTARSPFNLGRTATHEVGHWLNLIHTWGDDSCGTDQVADTPPQQAATYGDPTGVVISCNNAPSGNMYMDYMDFTDDAGMHMFTYGQRDRMRTLFLPGGFRYPILSSPAATAAPGEPADSAYSGGAPGIGEARIYPNPVANTATIHLGDVSKVGSLLEVYDQTGQRIMATRVTTQDFNLNVSGLSSGIYFIRLSNGGSQQSLRLVKM